jgi:hypothetical protein
MHKFEDLGFTLTARDTDLVGSSRLADPLGLLPIWSRIARELVPHLTAQTTRLAGFELLIVLLDAFDRPEMDDIRQTVSRREFFLIGEQLAAHAVTRHVKDGGWPLPGRRGAEHCARTGKTPLSLTRKVLLDNQAAGGVWGLYRGAAGRAGLLNASLDAPSYPVRKWLETGGRRLDGDLVKNLAKAVREVAKAPDRTLSKLQRGYTLDSALALELVEVVRDLPNRALLRRHLFQEHPLLREVATWMGRQQDNLDFATFLNSCRGRFAGHEAIFDNILSCERYIAVLDVAFERLLSGAGSVADLARALGIDLKTLEAARQRFAALEELFRGDAIIRRFRVLRDVELTNGAAAFVDSLVRAHHAVADQRGGSHWIEIENGRLRPIVKPDGLSNDDRPQGDIWRNDYYLNSVRSIYGEVTAR